MARENQTGKDTLSEPDAIFGTGKAHALSFPEASKEPP